MRALIFAAGRGSRLRPHTDWVPKPLLPVGKYRLWDWQISGLKKAGITDLVVNTAYLSDAFEPKPEAYAARGITMKISREGDKETDALETRGGIAKALPLLTDGVTPFVAVAGDVVHDYPMERLNAKAAEIEAGDYDAFMVAVPNPGFHVRGDMTVAADGTVRPGAGPHTYGCIMVVSPKIFVNVRPVAAKLFPWIWQKARVRAEVWDGFWGNIGSAAQYEALCEENRTTPFHLFDE